MRVAAIDVGTNSVLLVIGESVGDAPLRVLEERCTITRLGQGVDRSDTLLPVAIARTLDALAAYRALLDRHAVDRLAVVGTSALRDAANAEAFLAPARDLLGVAVAIIGGDREAELVLAGVTTSCSVTPGTLVFDVGGGSTELIAVDAKGGLAARQSLDLGSVRMTERHLAADPPSAEALAATRRAIDTSLASLPAALASAEALIGVAGTVTTLLTLQLGMASYDSARVDGAELSAAQVRELLRRLSSLPLAERRRLVGLEPARADVIVAGALIVERVLDHYGCASLRVSDKGVRWGLLAELSANVGRLSSTDRRRRPG